MIIQHVELKSDLAVETINPTKIHDLNPVSKFRTHFGLLLERFLFLSGSGLVCRMICWMSYLSTHYTPSMYQCMIDNEYTQNNRRDEQRK